MLPINLDNKNIPKGAFGFLFMESNQRWILEKLSKIDFSQNYFNVFKYSYEMCT